MKTWLGPLGATCSVSEGDLTGWSDHEFLTGQVMVGSPRPRSFLSKRFISHEPCLLFIKNNLLLKYQSNLHSRLLRGMPTQSQAHCYLAPPRPPASHCAVNKCWVSRLQCRRRKGGCALHSHRYPAPEIPCFAFSRPLRRPPVALT